MLGVRRTEDRTRIYDRAPGWYSNECCTREELSSCCVSPFNI